MTNKSICLAITGASGFRYATRLLQVLLTHNCRIHLLVSDAAREVAKLEDNIELPNNPEELKCALLARLKIDQAASINLTCYDSKDWLSPVASGSSPLDAMVICPCSTGTLSAVANGQSTKLIERAATVCLKERRRLLIVPREMPLSAIQLEQMHKLALMGVRILPASPGFYHSPKSVDDLVDFVVARILSNLDLPQNLVEAWGKNGEQGID